MPFYLHVPLPGPFSYSTRIGGSRRRGRSILGPAAYWVLIGWWLLPAWLVTKWTLLAVVWLCAFGYSLARGNARLPRFDGGRITNRP